MSWGFQKVQNHFCGWPVSWAIRDWNRSILSRFLKSLFLIFLIFRTNFWKNRSKFDRELLSSQTTHQNELILYWKILSWGFKKTLFLIFRANFRKKSLEVWSGIAQLTDHPLCKGIVLRILKSTEPFLWVACEQSYWRFKYP